MPSKQMVLQENEIHETARPSFPPREPLGTEGYVCLLRVLLYIHSAVRIRKSFSPPQVRKTAPAVKFPFHGGRFLVMKEAALCISLTSPKPF